MKVEVRRRFQDTAKIDSGRRLSAQSASAAHWFAYVVVFEVLGAMAGIGDGQTDVVGAGPVRLAAAIELGRRGVPCVVVERSCR
jgi:hypothetical protein